MEMKEVLLKLTPTELVIARRLVAEGKANTLAGILRRGFIILVEANGLSAHERAAIEQERARHPLRKARVPRTPSTQPRRAMKQRQPA